MKRYNVAYLHKEPQERAECLSLLQAAILPLGQHICLIYADDGEAAAGRLARFVELEHLIVDLDDVAHALSLPLQECCHHFLSADAEGVSIAFLLS